MSILKDILNDKEPLWGMANISKNDNNLSVNIWISEKKRKSWTKN